MSKKRILLLAESPDKRFNAGEKARVDVINILKKIDNTEHINFFYKGSNKIKVLMQMIIALLKLSITLKKDDIVVVQYPYAPIEAYKLIYNTIDIITKIKSAKKIAIIHDLNFLRQLDDNKKNREFIDYTQEIEIKMLSKFDAIICHNIIMKEKLVDCGLNENKLINLKIFDYLYDGNEIERNFDKNNIVLNIAGNLNPNKAGYINEIKEMVLTNISYELYGPGYCNDSDNSNIRYMGVVSPEEIPSLLKGNFGVVWDGDSLDECTGNLGKYTMYNNPHKASLYIACGLPLIVWKKSAVSKFVEENELGICVDSLKNVESILSSIDENNYKRMLDNVLKIRHKVIDGMFLMESIEEAITKV